MQFRAKGGKKSKDSVDADRGRGEGRGGMREGIRRGRGDVELRY